MWRSSGWRMANGGHTAVLALFDRKAHVEPARTTLDHLAFTIALADYEHEKRRLESLGFQVRTATHEWVKWRSLYVDDPDANTVELVCYDENV